MLATRTQCIFVQRNFYYTKNASILGYKKIYIAKMYGGRGGGGGGMAALGVGFEGQGSGSRFGFWAVGFWGPSEGGQV